MSASALQNIPLPRNYELPPNAKPGTTRYTWFPLDFLVPYVVSGRIDGLEYKALLLIQAQLAEQGKTQVPIPPPHFVFALRKCWRTCSTVLHRLSRKGFVKMNRFDEGDGRSWTYGWKPRAFDRDRIQSLELIPMQTKPPKPKGDPGGFDPEEETALEACVLERSDTTDLVVGASKDSAEVDEPETPRSEKTKPASTTPSNEDVERKFRDADHLDEAEEPMPKGRLASSTSLSFSEIQSWNCARQGCILLRLRTHPMFSGEIAPSTASLDKHEEIALRSVDLGMQAPDRHLTARISAKFPEGWSGEEIAQKLARFPGQQGPGLWAMKARVELEFEAARQAVMSARPTMSEKEAQRAAKWDRLERLAQMADEEEERRRRSAGQ